jgi:hypothetical protein
MLRKLRSSAQLRLHWCLTWKHGTLLGCKRIRGLHRRTLHAGLPLWKLMPSHLTVHNALDLCRLRWVRAWSGELSRVGKRQ